ncbi:gag/pol protein [Cucumis melo var. makuwa]|uniref:Gag/pol protein n=1 Tax=Cucumis melo var. makuwa TaxID=1194695 RepID=A0A5D3E0I9_CUCMM|nr:gag/pol protein [Cucumis melo var. makuwa]TYK29211.1 gag/pol protein [Cucumis melo var. makuwa]
MLKSITILLSITTFYDYEIWQMDVKTTFLDKSIYMTQPKGFIEQGQERKEQCSKKPQEVGDMRNIPYAFVVGSLMYATLCTRPDISYSVGMVSRYQSNLRHARKSTSGSVFTLNGGAVVWRSEKQTCLADSTMNVEYVVACKAAKEAIWLRKFLIDLEVVPNMHLPIPLYCDNSGAVAKSREPKSQKQGV